MVMPRGEIGLKALFEDHPIMDQLRSYRPHHSVTFKQWMILWCHAVPLEVCHGLHHQVWLDRLLADWEPEEERW